jgi:hypothetical protein
MLVFGSVLSGAQMRRFFFHIRDGSSLISDDEGMEFADASAVENEARLSANDIASQYMRANRSTVGLKIEVESDSGAVIASKSVRYALN